MTDRIVPFPKVPRPRPEPSDVKRFCGLYTHDGSTRIFAVNARDRAEAEQIIESIRKTLVLAEGE